MTLSKSIAVLLTILLILTGIIEVTAGGPLFWRIDRFSESGRGELRGITIDGRGAATLAPAVREVFDTRQAYIWSAIADQTGNIYLGTGNEGRVFRVDPAGRGELLYQTPELSVMALAVDARGLIYAGSSPDGKVYQITRNGEARVFFEPKSKYIWALAFDLQGRLLVATGEKGILYRVDPDGRSTILATLGQSNLTSMRIDRAGNILLGTDPGGMVVRVSPEGKVFTLFDSEQREIHDLALVTGAGGEEMILALALADSAGSGAATSAAAPPPSGSSSAALEGSVTVTLSDVQVVDATAPGGGNSSGSSSGSSSGQAKSLLYRIAPDGSWQTIWESRDAAGFSILPPSDGRLLLGLGRRDAGSERGRILTLGLDGQPEAGTLLTLPEGQVARIVQTSSQNQIRTYAASSNLGKLFAVGPANLDEGVVTGNVLDSIHHANWGELSWTGDGRVEFQTRSGNTSNPDQTWSEWSRPLTTPRSVRLESPPARYLQWRATLRRQADGPAPLLREVTIHYLPRNLAPRLTSVSTLPVGVALQPPPPQSTEGIPAALQNEALVVTNAMSMPPRRVFQQGALSLQWQGEDRNGDLLEYNVLYRPAAGSEWYTLRSGLRDNYLTIDSRELPDESYQFRLVVSDRLANPVSLALTGSRETEVVAIDNSSPDLSLKVESVASNRATIRATATDRTTVIRRAEYQLDGGAWLPVFPTDGLADSLREEFILTLDLPDRRPHLVALRVFDANSNIAISQITVGSR